MPPESQLFGADRAVLYLEVPTNVLDDIDGSKRQNICNAIEQFQKSPAGAFNKHPADYVGQIRDLQTQMRAFATWCQNEAADAELCVVQTIYRKRNQDRFFAQVSDLNGTGREFAEGIVTKTPTEYEAYLENARQSPDVKLVE